GFIQVGERSTLLTKCDKGFTDNALSNDLDFFLKTGLSIFQGFFCTSDRLVVLTQHVPQNGKVSPLENFQLDILQEDSVLQNPFDRLDRLREIPHSFVHQAEIGQGPNNASLVVQFVKKFLSFGEEIERTHEITRDVGGDPQTDQRYRTPPVIPLRFTDPESSFVRTDAQPELRAQSIRRHTDSAMRQACWPSPREAKYSMASTKFSWFRSNQFSASSLSRITVRYLVENSVVSLCARGTSMSAATWAVAE